MLILLAPPPPGAFTWRGVDLSTGVSGGATLSLPIAVAAYEEPWRPPATWTNLELGPFLGAMAVFGTEFVELSVGAQSAPVYDYVIEGDVTGGGALQFDLGFMVGASRYKVGAYGHMSPFGSPGFAVRTQALPVTFPDQSRGLVEARVEYL